MAAVRTCHWNDRHQAGHHHVRIGQESVMEGVVPAPGLGNLGWFASALAFALSMSGSPGPNNTMLAASGASWGFRRTIPHIAGVSIGFPAMLIVVACGAGAVLQEQPWIHRLLRGAGALYLVWLAWRIATTRPESEPGAKGSRPLGFVAAAAFQWVNPKAWLIATGAVVTYTTGHGDTLIRQALVIAAIFLVVTLAATAAWTVLGVGAGRMLHAPRARQAFNRIMAALLLASLLSLVSSE